MMVLVLIISWFGFEKYYLWEEFWIEELIRVCHLDFNRSTHISNTVSIQFQHTHAHTFQHIVSTHTSTHTFPCPTQIKTKKTLTCCKKYLCHSLKLDWFDLWNCCWVYVIWFRVGMIYSKVNSFLELVMLVLHLLMRLLFCWHVD